MTEFECLLTVHVFANDGHATGETLMVLPFAPFIGLGISDIQPGLDPVTVKDVVWDPAAQSFVVYLDSDDMTTNDDTSTEEPFTLAQLKGTYGGDWTWKDKPI